MSLHRVVRGVTYTVRDRIAPAPDCERIMQGPGSPQSPDDARQVRRRRLFQEHPSQPAAPPMQVPVDPVTAAAPIVAFYHQAVAQQIEDGIASIRETAAELMVELTAEIWRSAEIDEEGTQSNILSALSRDEAIRGLIAHSDERYQVVAMRVSNLEETLKAMSESTEAVKESVLRSSAVLQETASSPELRDAEEARVRLVEIEHHLTTAFQQLEERDSRLVETLERHVDEQRARVVEETGRAAVEAIEAPIQGGVEMIENLTQRVDERSNAVGERAEELIGRMTQTVEQQQSHQTARHLCSQRQADERRRSPKDISQVQRSEAQKHLVDHLGQHQHRDPAPQASVSDRLPQDSFQPWSPLALVSRGPR